MFCTVIIVIRSESLDGRARLWKKLKGMVGLPKFDVRCRIRLADYGGKIAVLWDKDSSSCGVKKKTLWCGEIALEKQRDGDEIWGTVEWVDGVLRDIILWRFLL